MELCKCKTFGAVAVALGARTVSCVQVRPEDVYCAKGGLFAAMEGDVARMRRAGMRGALGGAFGGRLSGIPETVHEEHGRRFKLSDAYRFRHRTARSVLASMMKLVRKVETMIGADAKMCVTYYCDLDGMADEDVAVLTDVVNTARRYDDLFDLYLRVVCGEKAAPAELLAAMWCLENGADAMAVDGATPAGYVDMRRAV